MYKISNMYVVIFSKFKILELIKSKTLDYGHIIQIYYWQCLFCFVVGININHDGHEDFDLLCGL